jgi:peptidoglycan-associated lipoprotein
MRFKLLGLMAALLLVAACGSDATEDTTASSGGETMAAPPPPPPPPPAPMPPMDPQEYFVINVGDRVFFDFDKSDLRPDAIDQLNRQADFLKANSRRTAASRSWSKVMPTSAAPASTTLR